MVLGNNFSTAHQHALILSLSGLTNKLKTVFHSLNLSVSDPIQVATHLNAKNILHNLGFSQLGPSAIITSRIITTNIKNFINRRMGLSTDTKPSPFILQDLLFHETDTGNLFTSDGITTSLTQGAFKSETYQSKIIDAELNDIVTSEPRETNPFLTSTTLNKKRGGIIPAATIEDSFTGIFGGNNAVSLYSPNTVISTPDRGMILEFRSIFDTVFMGFSTPVPVARRGDSYELKCEVQSSTNARTLVGFSTASQFTDSVLDDTDIGVVIGFTELDNVYTIYHNDGTGPVTKHFFSISKDQIMHTVEILMNNTNIVCKLDNEVILLTTKIPALTDDLYLLVYGIH